MLELLTGYIRDEIAYEFLYSKKTLVYIILIAVMARRVGPKETISSDGYFSRNKPHSNPA